MDRYCSPSLPVKDHIHSWAKFNRAMASKMFVCTDPDCFAYAHANVLYEKRVACVKCGNQFIVDKVDLRRLDLQCPDCSGFKGVKHRQIPGATAKMLQKMDIESLIAEVQKTAPDVLQNPIGDPIPEIPQNPLKDFSPDDIESIAKRLKESLESDE